MNLPPFAEEFRQASSLPGQEGVSMGAVEFSLLSLFLQDDCEGFAQPAVLGQQ